jgi:hypothetical protein
MDWDFPDDDTLRLYPERERWEHELWVWTDEIGGDNGMWIIAPRTKVWRHGEAGRELPILRTGSRESLRVLAHDFDVVFVSTYDRKIARFAAERAGLALPCKVDLASYSGFDYRKVYTTTITVEPEDN